MGGTVDVQTCQSKIYCHISSTIRTDIKCTNLYRHAGKKPHMFRTFFFLLVRKFVTT